MSFYIMELLESRRLFSGIQTFSDLDAGAGPADPHPNSDAAAASFDAAAAAIGTESIITFEGVPTGSFDASTNLTVATGVTLNGTNKGGNPQNVFNSPSDASDPALSGFNTTANGSEYVNLIGGTVTFTFASPIQFFGAYFTGVQTFFEDQIDFSDGTPEQVDIPGAGQGGVAFAGFVDPGASITSVTINGGPASDWDAFGVDDVRYDATPPLTGKFSSPNLLVDFFPGESGEAPFTITNPSTNQTISDTVDTQFFLETSPAVDGNGIPIGDPLRDQDSDTDGTVSTDIDLQPSETSSLAYFHFNIPTTTDQGNYYLVGDVDPSGNLTNDNSTGQVFSTPIRIDLVKPGDAASNVYALDTSSAAPTGYTLFDSATDYGAFRANAYENADKSQVIIAFRGTVKTSLENWEANASFGTQTTPSTTLQNYASVAANFVARVHGEVPDADIMLTGHSLGGAIAQLVGKESGCLTDVFNAPGAEAVFSALSTQLAPASNLDSGQPDTNYRVFGDQVSLTGVAIGDTFTMPPPAGTTFFNGGLLPNGMAVTADVALSNLLANAGTFLNIHDMDASVLPDLSYNFQSYSYSFEPNDVLAFEVLISAASSSSSDGTTYQRYLQSVEAGVEQLFDPTGSDFVLTADPGSPDVQSVDLPALQGVSSYNVRYQTDGAWSSFASVTPGTTYNVASGAATAVEFQLIDSTGAIVTQDSALLFGASFASTGTFSGSLISSGLATDATPGNITPSITKEPIKSAYVGGKATRGSFSLSLANTSTAIEKGPVTIDLYASPDGEIDDSSILIGSRFIKNAKVLAGKTLRTAVVGTLPAALVGNYTFLATAIDPAGFTTDANSGPTTKIAAPFVSLSASIAAAAPTTIAAGKVTSFTVTITNTGNIVASGAAKLVYGFTASGTEVASSITTVKREASIKAGGKLVLRYKLPTKGLSPGTYYPTIDITLGSQMISALAISPITVG